MCVCLVYVFAKCNQVFKIFKCSGHALLSCVDTPLFGTLPPDACSNAPRLLLLLCIPGVLLLSQHTLKWFPSIPMGLLEQGAKSERHEVSGASTIFMSTHSFYMANLHL